MKGQVAAACSVLERAIDRRIFPAAVAEVGDSAAVLWRQAFGTLTFDDSSPPTDDATIFDLASLTKPILTTSVVLQLVANGDLALDEPLSAFFEEWRGADREGATVQDLLEHATGLAARLVDPPGEGRREFEHDICTMCLEAPLRSKSIYSDLGFILLGFLAADRGRAPLAAQFDAIVGRAVPAGDVMTCAVGPEARPRTAPTVPLNDDVRRGRRLIGEVHDAYAAALGGVAGHAGLFGTAAAVGHFSQTVLRAARGDRSIAPPFSPELVRRAITKSTVGGSSRALGWDTMLPTSSCGTRMSATAFGHVGFTGTSLWIDPVLDRYFVLLTNRACDGGTIDAMRDVRRAFHDALATSAPRATAFTGDG